MDLNKIVAGDVPTSPTLDPGQEPLRLLPDPEPTPLRVGGSWAASWWLESSVDEDGYSSPGGRQVRQNRLGLPGFPEIDFRPYDYATNRMTDRGPSLVGHQVSFEVVGPTARSPFLDFQWVLTDNSGKTQGDLLTIDAISPRSELGSLVRPNFRGTPSIKSLFGIDAVPRSGLYLVISQTGAHAWLEDPPGEGGLPDGVAGTISRFTDREPVEKIRPESGYEVFRVVAVGLDYLEIDPAKRVAQHFTVPKVSMPLVRAVTLLRPAAARLVAMPDPSGKRPTTYVFVPPAKSLCGDAQPPYSTWTQQDPGCHIAWAGYATQPKAGLGADYGESVNLPIPRPVGSGIGHLPGKLGDRAVAPPSIGRWGFFRDSGDAPRAGQVLRVHRVERVMGASIWDPKTSAGLRDAGIQRCLGYFQVAQVDVVPGSPDHVVLRRLAELDPESGATFEAPFDAFFQQNSVAGQEVEVGYTLHDPIDVLWRRPALDIDALASGRLRGLVPPAQAGRSVQAPDGELPGQTPHRPDRAALDTSSSGGARGSCADPGSLINLGFRVVLYPARVGPGGELEPDFDRPVGSDNVVFDAREAARPIQVDYEAAALYLPGPPEPGPGCDLCPDPLTLSTPDNPRGEVVLFASFVARSMEPSGPTRVMGAAALGEDPDPCSESGSESADIASQRIWFRLAPQRVEVPGYPERTSLDLDAPYDPLSLPENGYVELLSGSTPDAPPMFRDGKNRRVSAMAYERVGKWGTPPKIRLEGVSGGGVAGSFFDVDPANPGVAVLRRTVSTPSDLRGRPGTDYRRDLNYGAAARPSALRFAGSRVRRLPDGSAEVQLRDARAGSHQRLFRDLFSPSILSGCGVVLVGVASVKVESGWVLLGGVRARSPEAVIAVPDGTSYVYLSGDDPCRPRPALFPAIRPLPGPEDVPLARVTAAGGRITEVAGLQLYLRDIDYRLDIFVGSRPDRAGYGEPAPHFGTLGAAVRYVGELLDPAVGLSGYQVRIRVVGPTQEAEVPIRIPCDGLVIEGVSQTERGSMPNRPWGVRWDHPAAPLIDLAGRKDVEVRDVAFVYDPPPGTLHAVPDRVVFTSTGLVENLLLDRVALYGRDRCHGLIFIPLGAKGLIASEISGCFVEGVTDFGVYVESGCSDLRISNCRMRASVTGPQTGLLGPAAVFLGPSADNALQSVVSGLSATGFSVGVWVERHAARVTTTDVQDTLQEAFVVSNGAQVELSSCTGRNIGVRAAPKIGIRVSGGRRFAARSCRIDLFAMGAGDYALRMLASPFGFISDLATPAHIQVDDDAVLSAGSTTGYIQTGARCHVSGSQADRLLAGEDCQISSSSFLGGAGSFLAARTTARGTRFRDLDVSSRTIVDGCVIDGSLSTAPGAQDVTFTSSSFGNVDVNVALSGSVFRGCRFIKSLIVQGDRNILDGNYVVPTNDANLVVQGLPGARSSQNHVTNNVLLGRGGLYVDADQSLVACNSSRSTVTFGGGLPYSIVVSGTQCVVAANSAYAGLLVGLSGSGIADCVVLSNSVSGELNCNVGTASVSGNRVSGRLAIRDGSTGTGNVAGDVSIVGRCVASGNHTVSGGMAGSGEGFLATGNWCEGPITLPDGGSRSTVTGNLAGQLMAKNHTATIASGNYFSSIFAQLASQSVFAANFADTGIDARARLPILLGNTFRAGSLQVLRDRTFVVLGNSGPSLDAPPAASDPDPSPNQAAVMGNRIGSIFGSPPDGRARGNAG